MKILVNNEIGREVNPYKYSLKGEFLHKKGDFDAYHYFETNVKPYPAPGLPDGEHECELVWQNQFWNLTLERSRWDKVDQPDLAIPHRQVFILSPLKEQGERSGVKTAEEIILSRDLGIIVNGSIGIKISEIEQLMKQYATQVAFQVRDECSKATDIVIMINISQFIK